MCVEWFLVFCFYIFGICVLLAGIQIVSFVVLLYVFSNDCLYVCVCVV